MMFPDDHECAGHANWPDIFDTPGFLRGLEHLGAIRHTPGGNFAYIAQPVGNGTHCDGLGPLPYSFSLGRQDPAELRVALEGAGLVAFVACFAPGIDPGPAWTDAGFQLLAFKDHHIFLPDRERTILSTRSRQNVRRATRHWSVEKVCLADCWREVAAAHEQMLADKPVLTVSRRTPDSFQAWAALPEIITYAARDNDGCGVWAIAARVMDSLHLVAVAAMERAYRTGGMYAMYDFLTGENGPQCPLYFGTSPSTQPGLARFKSRFSNASGQSHLAQILLRPDVSRDLEAQLGKHAWFPPYRAPHETQD